MKTSAKENRKLKAANPKIAIVFFIALLLIAALMLPTIASAVPVPLGIDGKVFELDGVTEVFPGIPVTINDTTAGIVIETRTGIGSSGRYSVALNGEFGDEVIVSARNPLHSTSRNITLTGVIHDFDLLLNMSLPQLPPEITSSPVTEVLEDSSYGYQVRIIEWNQDPIIFSVQGPAGMTVDQSGFISWNPKQEDVGSHAIKVIVQESGSDIGSKSGSNSTNNTEANASANTATQEFILNVINVNDPPEIKSIPVTKSTAGRNYSYIVVAEDPDAPTGVPSLVYSLIEKPGNMKISGNKIKWAPNESHIGTHNVIVEVSDGELSDSQEYSIEVGLNSPPEIISSPETEVIAGNSYIYSIVGTDADGDTLVYSLVSAPATMSLNNTILAWNPNTGNIGTHNIKIQVSDGLHTGFQEYAINVITPPSPSSPPVPTAGSRGGRDSAFPDSDDEENEEDNSEDEEDNEDEDYDSKKVVTSKGVKAKQITKRPPGVKRLQKLVYKYLQIDRKKERDGGAIINFRVASNWISERKVNPKDIVLARYTNKWDLLPTENTNEDKSYAYYESETPGFSYFAITIREGTETSLPEPNVEVIKEPFLVFGKIMDAKGKEVAAGTPFIAENLRTQQIIYGETGAPANGYYQFVMHGAKGDKIIVSVLGYYDEKVEFRLNNSKLSLDIKARSARGIFGITARAIARATGMKASPGTILSVIGFILIVLITSYVTRRALKKNKESSGDAAIEALLGKASTYNIPKNQYMYSEEIYSQLHSQGSKDYDESQSEEKNTDKNPEKGEKEDEARRDKEGRLLP